MLYGIILYIQSLFGSVGNHSSTVCSLLSCCCAVTAISDNFLGRERHEGSLIERRGGSVLDKLQSLLNIVMNILMIYYIIY